MLVISLSGEDSQGGFRTEVMKQVEISVMLLELLIYAAIYF